MTVSEGRPVSMRVVRLRAPGGPGQLAVEDAGPGVAAVAPGDEVFALTPFDSEGVAADYATVPAELLAGEAAVVQPR